MLLPVHEPTAVAMIGRNASCTVQDRVHDSLCPSLLALVWKQAGLGWEVQHAEIKLSVHVLLSRFHQLARAASNVLAQYLAVVQLKRTVSGKLHLLVGNHPQTPQNSFAGNNKLPNLNFRRKNSPQRSAQMSTLSVEWPKML